MDINFNSKQLVAVEYPGTVINVDNMCKTLGGENVMFKCFKDSSKRLEVRFRPGDPYCKCAHGDRFNTTNILIKVVKRTRKLKLGESSKDTDVQYNVDFLGVSCYTYKFKSLADFQLLPLSFDQNLNQYKSLLPEIVPTSLHPASWLDNEIDLFVPPVLFSRFDLPQSGYIEFVSKQKVDENKKLPPNIIGRCRKRRAGYAVFATFESSSTYNKPNPGALSKLIPLDIDVKNKCEKLFEERPIWSKNALTALLKIDKSRLKYSLPCIAYYFTNGPWRTFWVKFGYDPRKDPSAKIYQTLDFRINPNLPLDIKAKRSSMYYNLPNKKVSSSLNLQRCPKIEPQYLVPKVKDMSDTPDEISKELLLSWQYIPGEMPIARQSFYQLCDIHLDVVQELVHQNDGQEDVCLEKDGWCEPGTLEKCREALLADLQRLAKEKE